MSNDYEWLRFVDLDKIATDEEREKLVTIAYRRWTFGAEYYYSLNQPLLKSRLRNVLLPYAISTEDLNFVRFVLKLGASKAVRKTCEVPKYDLSWCDDIYVYLIDIGINSPTEDHVSFKNSRTAARLGAIVAMGAIRSRLWRERERGWKDISRIIGRLIWESRKYYQSD